MAHCHSKMHVHTKFWIPTLNYIRYAPDTNIPKTMSETKVKATVTRKWYARLGHPKIHQHTKFRIPTSKNIGGMHRTRSGMDGLTDGQCDYYMPPNVPLGA